ncbi:MAG: HEAT repeat domain-containing protein [Planctomycetaceae bacterium]
MSQRFLPIVFVLLVTLVAAVFLDPTSTLLGYLRNEPFLNGRSLTAWSAQLNGTPADNATAIALLTAADKTVAEPLLVALYGQRSTPDAAMQRWTAIELLSKHAPLETTGQQALLKALDDADEHVRSVAISSLHPAGVPAEQAVPELTRKLANPHAVVAARALSEYRAAAAPALPELTELLQDENAPSEARWNAARTIGKIGPDAASTVPQLIDELDNPEDTIREHAAEAIGDIGPSAAELGVPALRGVLQDPYVKVRRDAVRSLGYIGSAATAAVDDILPLLSDPEAIVRDAAKAALEKIAPERIPTDASAQ